MDTHPPMPDPTTPAALRLDTTGQLIGGPVVGPHDNRTAVRPMLDRCLAIFDRVGAN